VQKVKLTNETVEAIVPDGREHVYVDRAMPGFVLRVRRSGAKLYAIQYRHRGRLRRLTIGRASVMNADLARKRARSKLGRVADGDDVARTEGPRSKHLHHPKAGEVFALWRQARKDAGAWHGRTEITYTEDWDRHLAAVVHRELVSEIGEGHVEKIRARCEGRPAAAAAALRLLRAVLNFAERRGLRPRGSNPVRSDELYRSPRRVVNLSAADYAALGRALSEAEAAHLCSPWIALAIRLLALTGARKMEVVGARWEWYDRREGVLRLPETKTGPRVIVLPGAARTLLDAAPRVVGNQFIVAGHRLGGRGGVLDRKFYAARATAGLPALRVHDLRHAWATRAAELGVAFPLVAAALGHALHGMTASYVHVGASALRAPVDLVGDWIADAMAGREPTVAGAESARA
jgi:integrase